MLVGFGITLGIWIATGVYSSRRVSELEAEATAEANGYLQAQQLLTSARNSVLISSVYVRDALLDTSPTASAQGRDRVNTALTGAAQALAAYVPVADSDTDRMTVQRLRREITELRDTLSNVLESGPAVGVAPGPLLRNQVTPKRESVMAVAEELATLNRATFVAHQREFAAIYRTTQAQLWQMLGLAIVSSFGVAVFSARYAGRLERRVREQHQRDLDLQQDLRHLSARLTRVREQERRALARELHDDIGQMLSAIRVELALAERSLGEKHGATGALDDVRPIADRALQAVRDLSHLLHPSVLDDLGLVPATNWFLKNVRRRHQIDVVFQSGDDIPRLSSEIETAAYRIVQESVSNAIKHAEATCVTVRLEVTDHLCLTVEDDGGGFDVGQRGDGGIPVGLGLVSMRERASQAGGTFAVHSTPGVGTRITVCLPAEPPDAGVETGAGPIQDDGLRAGVGETA